jgi:hypothetical protein
MTSGFKTYTKKQRKVKFDNKDHFYFIYLWNTTMLPELTNNSNYDRMIIKNRIPIEFLGSFDIQN